MARISAEAVGGPNMIAFLDMIAVSEIGTALLARSDDGYNVIVGSTPAKPILFDDYSQHPRKYQAAMNSDAAGRYQFMGRYWAAYKQQLQLSNFGPASQDRWAIRLIRECRAIELVLAGQFDKAVHECRSRWASLPGAGYGQHENDINKLRTAYVNAGGLVVA